MLVKPSKCTPIGTYGCVVPVQCKDKVIYVDFCIAPFVVALNTAGLQTAASCCGHGKMPGNILLEDGTSIIIEFDKKKMS